MIKIPDIRPYSIMDKCVLDDFVNDVNIAFNNINSRMDKCIDSINNTNELINNAILANTNMNNEYKDSFYYSEEFINAKNINMSSNCEIDFEKHECKCKCISKSIINFYNISIDGIENSHIVSPNSNIYNYSISDKSVIECSFKETHEINSIYMLMDTNNRIEYSIYNSVDDIDTLISTGSSSKNIYSIFSNISVKKIKIILSCSEKSSVTLSYITSYKSVHSNYGEFVSKEIKLYNGTSNIKVNVSSTTDDYKSYIGFINKDDKVIWNNGDEAIKFNTSYINEKVVQNGYPSFGESIGSYKKLLQITDNTNVNSIEVLSGYGSWKYSLINGAFMNSDLSVIEYSNSDIVDEKFIDCEDYKFDIKAGDLVILEQTFESNVGLRTTIPNIYATQNGASDLSYNFRYKVVLNGERVTNIEHNTDIDIEIKKGSNKIQIIFNLKKEKDDSDYRVYAFNYINFKKYTSTIYYKKLVHSVISSIPNDLRRECFGLYDNNIVVNSILAGDRFFIKHEDYIDSDIHYIDYKGQYMKVIVKICMYNKNNKHTVIDRIWI